MTQDSNQKSGSDTLTASSGTQYMDQTDDAKFLIFRLGDELYGTPLLGVRQVLQFQSAKSVPNTAKHFKGLVSVRGQIMGVVDLRIRFNYPVIESKANAFLVFETDSGPLAAIVDRVEAVMRLSEEQLASQAQNKPNIKIQIPLEFLLGATSFQDQLVTLIDLNKTLSSEDYVEIQKAKLAISG